MSVDPLIDPLMSVVDLFEAVDVPFRLIHVDHLVQLGGHLWVELVLGVRFTETRR